MIKKWKSIEVDETPITDSTFKTQGWNRHIDEEEDYVYWTLPLPKDNPDGDTTCLISSADIDAEDLGLAKDTFIVSIYDYNGLGICNTEEEIEILYKAMTGVDIYDDKN